MLSRQGVKQSEDSGNDGHHDKNDCDGGGGGDGGDGDGGVVTGGRKRRGKMKGGAVTMTALSNIDVNVTGHHGCLDTDRGGRERGKANIFLKKCTRYFITLEWGK